MWWNIQRLVVQKTTVNSPIVFTSLVLFTEEAIYFCRICIPRDSLEEKRSWIFHILGIFICQFKIPKPTDDNNNMLVSNHFHSVKNFVFSSAKPRDFDGMLSTGLSVSIYTTNTPINKWRFNVTQLLHFL
jgi:hypothetical protein